MRLALFDLDHTLLDGDSNSLWLEFLVAHGQLSAKALARQAEEYARYEAGTLDIARYLKFHLKLLADRPVAEWLGWRDRFVSTIIAAHIPSDAYGFVAEHRARGDRVAILTATHSFLADGIAVLFDPIDVIAPQAVMTAGWITGHIGSDICFAERKISCLAAWMSREELRFESFSAVYFYSDSFNDLPLLEQVSHPIVVNGDKRLLSAAAQRGWPQLQWRRGC